MDKKLSVGEKCSLMNSFVMETLTWAKLVALGQIEGLHPVLIDIQEQSIPHVQGFNLAGVGVSDLCSEEMHWLVVGGVLALTCNSSTDTQTQWPLPSSHMLVLRIRSKLVRLHCSQWRLVVTGITCLTVIPQIILTAKGTYTNKEEAGSRVLLVYVGVLHNSHLQLCASAHEVTQLEESKL